MPGRAGEDATGWLSDAVALWRVCAAPASDVVDAAVECLVAGVDSPALRELAGESRRESRDILDPLVDQALDELGAGRLVAANPQRAALTVVLKRYERGGLTAAAAAQWAYRYIGHDGGDACEVFAEFGEMYDRVDYESCSVADLNEWMAEEADAFLAGRASPGTLARYWDLADQAGQASALVGLGVVQQRAGGYRAAATSLQQALEQFRGLGHRRGQAYALVYLGVVQQQTGDYRAAATMLQQALELSRDPSDRDCQSTALQELSAVQRLTGHYPAAAATLAQAQEANDELGDHWAQAIVLSELGALQRLTGDYRAAIASQQQALEALGLGETAAQGLARNELGLAQQETGDYAAAAVSHQQALGLLRHVGDPYGQAQVLNSLGELASRASDTGQAREHHTQALTIARQIGAPLQEARALEGIGHSHLQDAHPTDASAPLQQAFAIYQHIEVPDARRVQETLSRCGLRSPQGSPTTAKKAPNTRGGRP